MRTTMDINDGLLIEAKRLATERNTSLKAVVEDGLRAVLSSQMRCAEPQYAWPVCTRAKPVAGVDFSRTSDLLERSENPQ